MRDAQRAALETLPPTGAFYHHALAYGAWAPIGDDGKVPDEERAVWLADLAGRPVSPDYARAFARWRASFQAPGDRVVELTLASRLLIGHGNASATDVGLTLHHTWGVPIIPGTSLKGLLAHYVDAVYGPEDESDADRSAYRGVTWDARRIQRGPGDVYRALFGAPDADGDPELRERGAAAGASRGLVSFHDALYVPSSAPDSAPFAVDVLTVHQKDYYNSSGASWPNDHDAPNPVAFLSVRPGVRVLLALSGPADWTALAEQLLSDALSAWGIGGKTSGGYGRIVRSAGAARPAGARNATSAAVGAAPASRSARTRYPLGARVAVTRIEDPSRKGKIRFRADDGGLGHFAGSAPDVAIGATIDAWVANDNGEAYTLSPQPPRRKG
jgi:CRISPR-associated protein Cmr6